MDGALGHEDLQVRTGELHVERGADGPHLHAARPHDEGARGILRDGELRFALHEQHAALGGGELHDDVRAAVQVEDGAVGQGLLPIGSRLKRERRVVRRAVCGGPHEQQRDSRGGEQGWRGPAPRRRAAVAGEEIRIRHGAVLGAPLREGVEVAPQAAVALEGCAVRGARGEPREKFILLRRRQAAVVAHEPLGRSGLDRVVQRKLGVGRVHGQRPSRSRRHCSMKAMHFFTPMVSCADIVFSETPSCAEISACDNP